MELRQIYPVSLRTVSRPVVFIHMHKVNAYAIRTFKKFAFRPLTNCTAWQRIHSQRKSNHEPTNA